jgi:hypothetical protein
LRTEEIPYEIKTIPDLCRSAFIVRAMNQIYGLLTNSNMQWLL